MNTEKLWFRQSVEGLFIKGLADRITPQLALELKAHGIDLAALQPAYPAEVVTRAINHVVRVAFPHDTEAQAHRQLGHLFMEGYRATLIGGALVQVMRVIGPKRALERMQRNFRTGGNYLETTFTALGDHKAQLWLSDTGGLPDFYAGIIERGGPMAGAKTMTVTREPSPEPSALFSVEWTQ